jgi:hypothetical protein
MGHHWVDVHEMHAMGVRLIKDDLVQLEKTSQNAAKRVLFWEGGFFFLFVFYLFVIYYLPSCKCNLYFLVLSLNLLLFFPH